MLSRRKWTSTRTLSPALTSCHEEADSKMIYHLTILEENSKVIIRTSEHIPQSINLWLEVDLYAKNSLKYIDAMKLFNKLGTDLCRALTAFHVCTGSDYTAAFSRKGKIHPLKEKDKDKNEKNKTAQTVFGDMGFPDAIQEEFKVIKNFTCALYGKPKFNSVNALRLELFLNKYQPKKERRSCNQLPKKDERQFSTSLCISLTTKDEYDKLHCRKIAFIINESPNNIKPFELLLGIK